MVKVAGHITPTLISAGPHRARVNVSNRCVEVDVAIALDDARRFLRLHFAHFEVISAVVVRDADLVADRDARESAQLSLEDCARVRDLQEVRVLRLELDERRLRERDILHCQQPALPRELRSRESLLRAQREGSEHLLEHEVLHHPEWQVTVPFGRGEL